jgi:cobalt-zinc-cadmium efflux system outer membrane protein
VLVALFLALVAAPQPLTLEQALARAAKQNPELLAVQRGIPVAKAGVEAAGQLQNPTVAFSAGPDEPTLFGTIAVRLPVFGQRGTAVNAAQAEVPVAQAETAALTMRLLAAVRRAYFALATADAQEALGRQTEQLAAQLAQMAEEKFRNGTAPQLEAEQARLSRTRAAQDHLDRASVALAARVALAQLLGDPPDEDLRATDALSPVPQPPPLESLLAKAQQNPEVQSLRRRREAALLRADRERAAVRPVPEVALELEKLNRTPMLGLRAALAFEAPFLSWNRGRVHEQEALAAAAEAQERAAVKRLTAQVRAARVRWEAAARRARFYESDFVPAALRLLEMARAAWQLGRAPLVSVLQAQTDLAVARSKALDAASEAQNAFADLEEAAGGAF